MSMTPSKQAAEAAEEIIGQWAHIEDLDNPERFITAIIDARFAGLREAGDRLDGALQSARRRITHDPYCNHNHRLNAIRRCDCGRDDEAKEIDAALDSYAAAKGGAR